MDCSFLPADMLQEDRKPKQDKSMAGCLRCLTCGKRSLLTLFGSPAYSFSKSRVHSCHNYLAHIMYPAFCIEKTEKL
ncbi:hypothetical protein E2C01_075235 [Portunus trituberculatus]|uniref:Uncharacterized protein n=1 Tax=Portunus trituberculatus TaxID=210409 RepID=A0A5B7IFN2_PORTR|nr:hypothetical protein [Portunus trituberculatus]